ncbi:Rad4-domain-containing protein [Aaosphaeria arxii CBS 175.79]|uniref:Rad4-domain-containing protein n=1 Tax=Aaosphaeria arxii CBS 175.79 TaxID=1450172 RepID=A0A6A5Y116_9PLEO|nr:Rad4-domain-containing protein [Aaosphaeria arxii CBS 175.79]KAF2019245.1 Rad4-domain-containing protein [Aaosphaeria arxii CBS 175.79]
MPPILPRKRLQSDSPPPAESQRPPKRHHHAPRNNSGKHSVFRDLDAAPAHRKVLRTPSQTEALLGADSSSSSSSSLSSAASNSDDSDEFEDVQIGTSSNSAATVKGKRKVQDAATESEEEEDWEDALGQHHQVHDDEPIPEVSGDLNLNLSANAAPNAYAFRPDGKKGPTKIQRQIRSHTHCMHVQFLMYHNGLRNVWIQDKQVQEILVEKMTVGAWKELEQYWRDTGIENGVERVVGGKVPAKIAKEVRAQARWKDAKMKGVKVYAGPEAKKGGKKGKAGSSKEMEGKGDKGTRGSERNQRDWGASSDRLEPNRPNMSAGDPLLRLLTYLAALWKSHFKVRAPSLRKRGYLEPAVLEAEVHAWRESGSQPEYFGERIESKEAFRELAKKCEGSRDVGQQLFTALLRGLGIESRMVASLQPVGFGWSQAEEGKPKDLEKLKAILKQAPKTQALVNDKGKGKGNARNSKGSKDSPIDVGDEDSSALSDAISISSDSDVSTPRVKQRAHPAPPFPTYWTEAISDLTHTPIAVCPGNHPQRSIVAPSSNAEALKDFYIRSSTTEKSKQIFAYIVAFSSDRTAKDVTTRYLPNHQWPGRTKGFRMPIEKIPIHNKRGKVKKWEEFDWFKSVMRPYARSHQHRQLHDEIEDEGDLVPKKPDKPKHMDEEGGKETLQGYKNSAEYVLERHLRREEALKPGAKIVRHFVTGKGDKEKSEPVYRRKDIATCKTVESWHKEGREVRIGEQPWKLVPIRAVTVTRKREIEERERVEGEKAKQGLYARSQTEWIIPDPIQDGKIPRNAFGNIDVYVPTMIPKGAVHVPLRGTAKICRKLCIDYAEACTGFEFGKQRAVPVLTGVVVAAENEDLVIDSWEVEQAAKEKKDADKREALLLGLWKKFYVGLRIVHRMKAEYGEDAELPPVEHKATKAAAKKSEWDTFKDHQDFEGGFLREEEQGHHEQPAAGGFVREDDEEAMAGGFFPASQEEQDHNHASHLTIDHGEQETHTPSTLADVSHRAPISLHSALQDEAVPDDADSDKDMKTNNINDDEPSEEEPPSRNIRKPRNLTQPPPPRTRTTKSQPDPSTSSSSSPLSQLSSLPTDDEEQSPVDDTPYVAPKRRAAARKSEEKVKSHFFAHGSDDETDLTDRSPKKGVRGGSGSRGRGRGRGRGRRGKV